MRSSKKRSISPSRRDPGPRHLDPPATGGPSAAPAASGGSRRKPPPNAFTPLYLEQARHLEEPPFLHQGRFAGPWDVETVETPEGPLHAVVRRAESVSEGGRALAVFPRRVDALVTAASFAALATRSHLSINTSGSTAPTRRRLGFPLHDGTDHIGHLSRPEEELLPYLHAVRCLVANPEAMSLALEALGSEVSAMVGRAVMRRLV